MQDLYKDCNVFVHHSIFLSSLSISLLYFTTLSFDGIFISWLKTHSWSAAFIAGMRSVTVLMGLLGTLVMPFAEKRLGVVRAGMWSICMPIFESCVLLSLDKGRNLFV